MPLKQRNQSRRSVSLPVQGRRLIDYRSGNSLHFWELGLRGECSLDKIELMKSFILTRRNKEFGHDADGKLLSKEQIATFFARPNLDKILDSLVTKKYRQGNIAILLFGNSL
jgi:DNA (cytosine-5)-methyltransferase 1